MLCESHTGTKRCGDGGQSRVLRLTNQDVKDDVLVRRIRGGRLKFRFLPRGVTYWAALGPPILLLRVAVTL
jgi:hypothetical protein